MKTQKKKRMMMMKRRISWYRDDVVGVVESDAVAVGCGVVGLSGGVV